MDETTAKARIKGYLRSHFIEYSEDVCGGADRITMVYSGYERSPDKLIESCIRFFPERMECLVYYSKSGAKWCRGSSNIPDLFRLLNYINAAVWPRSLDGIGGTLYKESLLYTPRIYMTEDGMQDITAAVIVPYDFYEIAPLETEDFLTMCLPELMDALSPAVFLLLLGEITLKEAVENINMNVLS